MQSVVAFNLTRVQFCIFSLTHLIWGLFSLLLSGFHVFLKALKEPGLPRYLFPRVSMNPTCYDVLGLNPHSVTHKACGLPGSGFYLSNRNNEPHPTGFLRLLWTRYVKFLAQSWHPTNHRPVSLIPECHPSQMLSVSTRISSWTKRSKH